jgi:RNA polymerase-interacting CarD/CdnL/TRCF family regulator
MATTKTTFKVGQKVTHAKHGNGKVTAVREASGTWYDVDFGDKKNPNMKSVRPSTVTKV